MFFGTTSGGSVEAGTCAAASNAAPENVFTWTPAVSGTAILETCGGTATAFDTVAYARTGHCALGTEVGCNDDTAGCDTAAGVGTGSRVLLPVTAGTPYFPVVDGKAAGAFGNYRFKVIPPAGTCAAPNVIPPAGGMVVGKTSGASAHAGSGACTATTNAAPENVYSWTPAANGVATVETCSTSLTAFNTVLYVRDSLCPTGLQIACNNDTIGCDTASGAGQGSRTTFAYTAGTTYFLFVDGFDGTQLGDYTLKVMP